MGVRLTPQAVDVIRRSLELQQADPSEMGVRLRRAGGAIRPRFAIDPEPGDVVVESDGVRVFIEAGIAAEHDEVEVAVSDEHDELVVRKG